MRWLRLAIAVAAGWAALLALPWTGAAILRRASPWIGAGWIATAGLTLNCFELAIAGFVAGRMNRRAPMTAVLVLAATAACVDFGELVPLHAAWLIRLTRDLVSDSRFLDSWVTTLATHALLLGCLVAGGVLSRAAEKPLSMKLAPD